MLRYKLYVITALLLCMGFAYYIWQDIQKPQGLTHIGSHVDNAVKPSAMLDEDTGIDPVAYSGLQANPSAIASLLLKQYQQTRDIKFVPPLVSALMQAQQYEKLLPLFSILGKQSEITQYVTVDMLFTSLLNGTELNFKNIDTIKSLLQQYYDKNLLTKDQLALYSALITFTRGDYNNYSYFMDQLDPHGKYKDWKTSFASIKEQYQSYPGVSTNYLDALIAMDIFKRGYPNVAKTNAQKIETLDPHYLLPKQIIAYAYIFQANRTGSLGYLDQLIDKDAEHKDQYAFYKSVAQYFIGAYQESVLTASQIQSPEIQKQILPYLFLSYHALQDRQQLEKIVKQITQQPLSAQEYLAFFYELLWKQIADKQLQPALQISLAELLRTCYAQLAAEQSFVCLYGKSAIMYLQGETERSYDALRQVVTYYPQDYLYEALAVLATKQGNSFLARKYIQRASSLYTPEQRTALQERVLTIKN